MIIKSHVRGGYRAAAEYLKQVGSNESVRLVEFSEPGVRDMDEAFRNMWIIGKTTRARKPLHHVSINPYKDERLTDTQVLRICACLGEKYGYEHGEHQRVIVEHVKDGRQHFHVMWNRVNLRTGRPVWPGHHWRKSKYAAREMEAELGLKRPVARRTRPLANKPRRRLRLRYRTVARDFAPRRSFRDAARALLAPMSSFRPIRDTWPSHMSFATLVQMLLSMAARIRRESDGSMRVPQMGFLPKEESSIEELIAWAWENRRADILARYGIYVGFDL